MFRVHFSSDAPIHIRALFFVGESHYEKHGMGRMPPGVSVYSRKVLIKSKSDEVLPDWMRFFKGAHPAHARVRLALHEHASSSFFPVGFFPWHGLSRPSNPVRRNSLPRTGHSEGRCDPGARTKPTKSNSFMGGRCAWRDAVSAARDHALPPWEVASAHGGPLFSWPRSVSHSWRTFTSPPTRASLPAPCSPAL